MAVVAVLACCEVCFAQERTARPDPEFTAIMKAEREGRLVDADKLLADAIRSAEQEDAGGRRLRTLLNHQAGLRMRQGRPDEAAAIVNQMIGHDEKLYGPLSLQVAEDYSDLGVMRESARDDAGAEEAFVRGLSIARQVPSADKSVLPRSLRNLADFYMTHGRADEAEPLIEEGLHICDANHIAAAPTSCAAFRALMSRNLRQTGHENAAEGIVSDAIAGDPDSRSNWLAKVKDLETLARQYEEDKSYDLAEATYQQAMKLMERHDNPDHPFPPISELESIGSVLLKEGRNADAEESFKKSLHLQIEVVASRRPDFARFLPVSVILLANLYRDEGRLADVEPILLQWLAIQERAMGTGSISLVGTLNELAQVYSENKKYEEAEPVCQRSLKIQEANLGPDDPHLIGTLWTYAQVLRGMGDNEKAGAVSARAEALQKKVTATIPPPKQATP